MYRNSLNRLNNTFMSNSRSEVFNIIQGEKKRFMRECLLVIFDGVKDSVSSFFFCITVLPDGASYILLSSFSLCII